MAVLALAACASQGTASDAALSCKQAISGCKEIGGACVMLRYSQDAKCDESCQQDVMKKIRASGISVLHVANRETSDRGGCVDYRNDIGGNARGAQCLAQLTGYEFRPGECRSDGWAYSIVVP